MFEFYHNIIPSSFSISFTSIRKVHNYNTRLSLSSAYYTPAIRTNYGKLSLRYEGPLMWNSIDDNTKKINHRRIFKQKIKAQFLKTEFISEIYVSQNFKRHYQTLVFASCWIVS